MEREHRDPGCEGVPEAGPMKALLAGLVGFASGNPPGREAEVACFLANT